MPSSPGDQVGLSGLQRRYDRQLRGAPGVQVRLLPPRPASGPSAVAEPEPESQPHAQPCPEPERSPRAPVTVFEAKPVAGKDLTITLSVPLQSLAETDLGRDEAGGGPGGDPSVHRGGDRRRQQRRHRRLLGGHRRPGPTRLDLQGGDDAGPAPCGPAAFVAGELPGPVGRRRQAVRELQRLPEQRARRRSIWRRRSPSRATPPSSVNATRSPPVRCSRPPSSLGLGTDYDVGFSSYFGSVPTNDTGPAGGCRPDRAGRGAGVAAGHGRRRRLGRRWPYGAPVPGGGDQGHLEGEAAHGRRGGEPAIDDARGGDPGQRSGCWTDLPGPAGDRQDRNGGVRQRRTAQAPTRG